MCGLGPQVGSHFSLTEVNKQSRWIHRPPDIYWWIETASSMALRRRGNEYRTYLRSTDLNAAPPYQTWRRWLRQGKITEERLLEMGINPRVRRRRTNVKIPAQDTGPDLQWEYSDSAEDASQTNGNSHNLETLLFSVPEKSSCGTSRSTNVIPSALDISQSLTSDIHLNSSSEKSSASPSFNVDESLSSKLSGDASDSDLASLSLSGLSASDDSSDSDGSIQDKEANRISSILESKSLGTEELNQPLKNGLEVTKFEALLMMFHLAMRHSLTDAFLKDLIQFVNELIGVPDALPESMFLFHKLFMFGSEPKIHFFCPKCSIYLGAKSSFESDSVSCDSCDWMQSVTSLNLGHYFVTLGMREQLQNVLSKPNIKFIPRERTSVDTISDISDGLLYQKKKKKNEVLANPNALTVSMSTDGSPIFKSGPNTLYPIHFHLNEIEPARRFDVENILLAGLWFSKSGDPNLQIFLKPMMDELQELRRKGITWRKTDGSMVESPIYLLCCCADSVARPKVLNMMQFNGSYGCSYCLHPNTSIVVKEPVKASTGIKVVFDADDCGGTSMDEDDGEAQIYRHKKLLRYLVDKDFPLKTNKGLRKHMEMAVDSGVQHMYGAKGLSILTHLKDFNMIFGIPIDYMHAVLLGVMKRLAGLWFDQSSHKQAYYIGGRVDVINHRLAKMRVPSNMASPRAMTDRCHWKAMEWRGFLLYYGLPCLYDFLPEVYYSHFRKLVCGIHFLCRDSIAYSEVDEANRLLQEFVWDYQNLYGEKHMVFNVHLLTHLAKTVSQVGPLWAYSMFPFESANGRLVKIVKGTRGVVRQIARKYLMTHRVSKVLRENYTVRESVLDFCCNVVEYKYLKDFTKASSSVTLLGKPSYVELDAEQRQVFIDQGIYDGSIVNVYNRAVVSVCIFSSRKLGRQIVHNDSCVRLHDGTFALIDYIVAVSDCVEESDVWCLVTEINIALNASNIMPAHIKQCSLDPFGDVKVISVRQLGRKCIFISCDCRHFVAEVANVYEKPRLYLFVYTCYANT